MQMVLTLTPGGQALATTLGFTAATATVDNFTSSYVNLTDVGKVIPPWTYGAVVALPDGLRQANATLTATVPAIPGPPVPKIQTVITWTDQVLPPDPGHLLQQVTTQQATLVKTVSANAGATVNTDVAIPAGSLAIGYAVRADGTNDTPQSVNLTGDQSVQDYFLVATATNSDGPQSVPLDPADTTLAVSMTANAAHPSAIDIIAWPVLPVVTVRQNKGALPIGVFLERSDGTAIDLDNPSAGVYEVGVSNVRATPAPWQKRPYDAIADSGEPGAGAQGIATVAAAVGKRQTCGMIRAEIVGNAGVAAAVVRFRLRDGASGVGAILQSWTIGVTTTVGASSQIELSGLGIRGTSGNAMTAEFSAGIANAFESCGLGVWQD